MELQSKDTALLFKVTHSRPIEMGDFVSTINSLGYLFESFARQNAESAEGRKARLYVEKIEHGSIEVLLTEALTASAWVIPFVENFNSIVEFAGYLKMIVTNAVAGKADETKLSIPELKALHDLFAVSANDPEGKMTFKAFDRSNVNVSFNDCTVNFGESNAAQNHVQKAIERGKDEIAEETVYSRRILTVHQLRRDNGTNAGNRGVIDGLSTKPLPLVFETDELKSKILYSTENPTLQAYLVDVVLQTSGGKPIAYKIMALHDIVPIDD